MACLVIIALCLPAHAQRLEAITASTSLNVTQTIATNPVIPMGPNYTLLTAEDRNRYDEIGYRLALSVRWKLGSSGFFAQPEVAFTNTRGQFYFIEHYAPGASYPDQDNFGHTIHRWETALLVGKHTSRRTYVLGGPVLALNQQQAQINVSASSNKQVATAYNSLFATVIPVQLLVQAGIGVQFGRFDFNLRLEQSLTPYTRRGTFEGATYGYEQQIRQGLFTAGVLLYKPKPASPEYTR